MTNNTPVTKSNTYSALIAGLHDIHGLSFRTIADLEPFKGIPVGTVYSIYRGNRVPNKWREKLGMSKLVKVPEHMVRKTKPSPKPDTRNRRAVNLDDPASAARTLRKHGGADFVNRLIVELENEA